MPLKIGATPADVGDMPSQARWIGVGRSDARDARAAADEAVGAAMAGREAALLVLFASEDLDLPVLVRTAYAAGGGARLIGCTTAGEIAASGPGDGGAVVLALGGDGFAVAVEHATGIGAHPREAGAYAATALAAVVESEHRVLMLLSDGLRGDQQEIVRGAHSVAGAGVPLVGGCAGDDLRMAATHQFVDDQVLDDAVVSAAIGSDAPIGIGVRHGWDAVGEPMLVTAGGANRVRELDSQPALDVYLDRLGAPDDARTDPEAFTRFALSHPLGMARREGEEQVRWIPSADFADRSLVTVAEVPQGALVRLMEGGIDSVLAATDAACEDAIGALGGAAPRGLLVFDCVARRAVLGDEGIRDEVGRVAAHAAGAPVAGFYTYGEIARTRGVTGFHNKTLVVLAVA